jgi:hypothetical protein
VGSAWDGRWKQLENKHKKAKPLLSYETCAPFFCVLSLSSGLVAFMNILGFSTFPIYSPKHRSRHRYVKNSLLLKGRYFFMGYKVWITSAAYRFGNHKSNERLYWEISFNEAN